MTKVGLKGAFAGEKGSPFWHYFGNFFVFCVQIASKWAPSGGTETFDGTGTEMELSKGLCTCNLTMPVQVL